MQNFILADYISSIKLGKIRGLRCMRIIKTNFGMRLTHSLYVQGIFRSYKIEHKHIKIYYKFLNGRHIISNIYLVSKPSKREYWHLHKLARNYSLHNFAGFYVISTEYGLLTSDMCLLNAHVAGEILFYVEL